MPYESAPQSISEDISPERAQVPLVVREAGERRRVARTQRELAQPVLVLGLHRARRAVADDGVPLGDLVRVRVRVRLRVGVGVRVRVRG